MALIGTHVGLSDTFFDTFRTYNDIPIQFMLPSHSPTIEDIIQCRKYDKVNSAYIHTCLTSNLAGSVKGEADSKYKTKLCHCRRELIKELDIGSCIGCGCVVHVGWQESTHKGMLTVIDTITECLTKSGATSTRFKEYFDVIEGRKIILENSAGEKNRLGSTLQELKFIYTSLPEYLKRKVKFCIDTAHLFGAGIYDFGKVTHVQSFIQDFGNTFGLDKLELFHLNDSAADFGSSKDLHESLGRGFIYSKDGSMMALKELVNITASLKIPMISETGTPIQDFTLLKSLK